jgi:hypothetical protein
MIVTGDLLEYTAAQNWEKVRRYPDEVGAARGIKALASRKAEWQHVRESGGRAASFRSRFANNGSRPSARGESS